MRRGVAKLRMLTSSIWTVVLLASVVWMVGGAFITSDGYEDGRVGSEVTDGIQSLASGANLALPAAFPPALVFIITGLPLALVSLFFVLRGRSLRASAAAAPGEANIRRRTILVTALSLAFALLLWNMQDIESAFGQPEATAVILFPVRLFVTFVHEAGHALAGLLTGGQVEGFQVSWDGSGVANIAGGSVSLIAPAGYLGAALFGALLFFLTNRIPRWTRALSFLIGVSVIALSLAFAMPGADRSATALIVGTGFGVGLMALGWFAPRMVNVFVLNTLAVLTGLNALFDLWLIVSNPGAGTETALNDAARFSSEITPLLPPAVVAFIWAAVAVGMMALAMYFGLIKQVEGEIKDKIKNGN